VTRRQWIFACVVVCILAASTCWSQADRPRRKMIEALTAIDVSAGVDDLEYRASLPWMLSQALVYSGVKTNYAEFCAVSGWSAEFHYALDKVWLTYLTFENLPSGRCFTRGVQLYGKRFSVFGWPKAENEQDRLLGARAAWEFIIANIAAGVPVLTDYIDGGVLYGYDETLDDPAIYFSTNGPGFGAIKRSTFNGIFQRDLHGLAVLADDESGPAERTIFFAVLTNLLLKAYEPESDGAPAGLAAMQALTGDLLSQQVDWKGKAEWLCRPLAEQSEARLCTAVYLRRHADLLGDAARLHLLAAADHYEQAFRAWRDRWEAGALTDGEEDERPADELIADTGRREAIAGHVCRAMGAELLALGEVAQALEAAEAVGEE